MDPSIVKLLEDDEDETMHSGADVEAFQAALNRDIGGDTSTSQPSGSDAVLSQGSSNTFSQSLPQWPTTSHDNLTDRQIQQDPKIAQKQEQPSSEMEMKQHGSIEEQNHPPLSQKQSQEACQQGQTVQGSLQNSQTTGISNPGKDSVLNNEPLKTHNPSNESQYFKLQQMSNQQATVTEQPSNQMNRSKQVPFGLLLPILIPQLPKDSAMQLQTLFNKLKKDEIPKDNFVRLMKAIVGDQMLRLALAKVQSQVLTRTNQGLVGKHPMRMPNVSSGATQFNDPHALAQLHQRSVNAPADQSHITSSTVHVKNESIYPSMENNAKKSQELDVKLPSSNSNPVSQEAERSSMPAQGLNKQQQQHLHFPSAYGGNGGNYNTYSGTTSTATSLKSQPHDSHLRQISHQNIGPNHLGGATQGMNVIGLTKLDRQNSINDPKRMPGGSVSSVVNNTGSQQTSNAWQPSTNKDQSLGLLSSVSYVKKEPNDLSTEQQHRHHLSKLHGLSSVNSSQIEQGSGNLGTLKDEFSRGLPASTSMPPTTSSLLTSNSTPPSLIAQLEPSVPLSSQISSNPAGINARTPLKKPSVGQKKPLEALGSSPPPPSKKQKASGASLEQSIEQLNDVTAVSGVDLREEEEQLFSGPKEDSRMSEASRRVVQEEEERLILQKAPLQKKLIDIMAKCGLKGMSNDVEKCLSLCVEERMRGLISNLIRLSKQRVDFEKTRHRVVVTSDVRQQIMTINKKAKEEWEKKQAEAEKLRKVNETDGNPGVDGDKDKDDSRNKSTKVNKEEDDKMRTNAANVAARAAVGGDDMLSKWQLMAEQARQKREGVTDSSSSQPAKDVSRKSSSSSGRSSKDNQDGEKRGSAPLATSGAGRKLGRNQAIASQTRVARSISVKDVIAALEREPQMSKSPLIYRLYDRIHCDAPAE
ncbi:transcription initiation factor TFIID subunit 4b-like isoform X1 [Senna tora]|uniref:Transcription initiation factor TFIID subunit 4b-like isoform X1 n=1 Tax=Senna tora TaxID=362788 RepID=A0A834U1H5_9FABA|nr:transcription initiation factor TFIID subunit 4b-like isoform X1 [Senna tora]